MSASPVNPTPPIEYAPSSAEQLFVEILTEALGLIGVQSLQFQVPFLDLDKRQRFIDFALQSPLDRYAFEIDGEYFHRPDSPAVTGEEFRDGLQRQNALVWQGWRVYRWTDTQLSLEKDRVIDQLRLFLERELSSGVLEKSSVLPQQEGAEFPLRQHQSEALIELERLRREGKTIALLTHATGTGKTRVAVADAKRMGLRTLYLAHTEKLPRQAQECFRELWPEATSVVYRRGNHEAASSAHVVLSTFQSAVRNLTRFNPREFGYVIIDEAHHAAADTFLKVVEYFQPRFLLGLTATPDRHDNRSLLQIFRETAHRLTLEEAIERGLLVPIRCLRVKTNVDLQRVRYNGVDYRLQDLESVIQIPARNELIAKIYLDHAYGRRAVCFCVNVDHAERVAEVFRSRQISAESVSGRMTVEEREDRLRRYDSGELKVLCACDMLNEGWDSPATEVLLMARPTLSKVLYVQQLGRGTRLHPGKTSLLVFDFVDQAERYSQALSLHRVFGKDQYRPGALVAAPTAMLQEESDIFTSGNGQTPPLILGLNIFDTSLQPIDIFRWQDEAAGMITAGELARELRVDDDTIRQRIRRDEIKPDLTVPVGEREHHYFRPEQISELQRRYGVEALTEETIKDVFMEFVAAGDMASSYKPVLLLGMLHHADRAGRVRVQELVAFFRDFYMKRAANGLLIEAPKIRMSKVAELSDLDIERTMLAMPFEKFERKGFFRRQKDLAFVRFTEALWHRLNSEDRQLIIEKCRSQTEDYYRRIALGPAAPPSSDSPI
jgi:superfamily II DNA or RNA helicase